MNGQEIAATLESAEQPTAMQVFWEWERLRQIYNLILAAVVICWLIIFWNQLLPRVILLLPINVIVANVCFCAGPVAENYLCWWGDHNRSGRIIVFVVGTFFAAVLAVNELNYLISFGGLGA